jgi:mannose-6-phosphate isomerase-like protein (cupin superfamily)
MKYGNWDIGGEVVKEDDRYTVKDNKELKNLIVSSTRLNPNKSTTGHKHKGQEEVYLFLGGIGTMELDDETFSVCPGDTVLIKDGVFHRVHAGDNELYFVCVFDGKRYNA